MRDGNVTNYFRGCDWPKLLKQPIRVGVVYMIACDLKPSNLVAHADIISVDVLVEREAARILLELRRCGELRAGSAGPDTYLPIVVGNFGGNGSRLHGEVGVVQPGVSELTPLLDWWRIAAYHP